MNALQRRRCRSLSRDRSQDREKQDSVGVGPSNGLGLPPLEPSTNYGVLTVETEEILALHHAWLATAAGRSRIVVAYPNRGLLH